MTPPSDNQPSDLCADLQISLLRGQVEVLTGANRTAYLDREQLRVEIAAARAEGERAATERIAAGLKRMSMIGDFDANGKNALAWASWAIEDPTFGERLESTSGTVER